MATKCNFDRDMKIGLSVSEIADLQQSLEFLNQDGAENRNDPVS